MGWGEQGERTLLNPLISSCSYSSTRDYLHKNSHHSLILQRPVTRYVIRIWPSLPIYRSHFIHFKSQSLRCQYISSWDIKFVEVLVWCSKQAVAINMHESSGLPKHVRIPTYWSKLLNYNCSVSILLEKLICRTG